MIGIDIIKTFDDPRLIGGYIKEQDNSFFNWKVFFKSIYAIPMDQEERKVYRKFTERRRPPKQPIESIYCVSGRKSGKSLIASCLAVYTSVFENFWKSHVRPGQKIYYPVIATDKIQAREVFQYCNGILNSNPTFRRQVARSLTWEIELKNSVVILIRTANFKAVRGPLYIGAILDELAFMKDENSVNPADELIKGIMPGLIPGSKLIGISSAYAKFGILYSEYNKYFGKDDPNTLIWLSDTMSMNPFFNERKIERALEKDYSHARAEYYSAFREDIESYIPPELIDEMTVPGRFRLAKKYRTEYFAFLDPSGGRQDSFTLGISHKGRKKIVLDVLEERIPPFRPKNVVKEYVKILNRYGISKIYADHYAEAWVQESFEDLGIDIEYSDLTASELYLNFLPLLSNGAVELLDNKKLKAQFVGLERRTRPGGKDLVTHYSRGHDDLANVCAGSIVMVNMQGEEQPSWVYHLGMKEEEEAKEDKKKKLKKKPAPKPFGRLPEPFGKLPERKKKKEPEPRHDESWVM